MESAPRIKIHVSGRPFPRDCRPRWLLEELGIAYDTVPVDLFAGGGREPEQFSIMGFQAATDIMTKKNRAFLEVIDGDVLLDGEKLGTTPQNDFLSGGANASQLMHRSTGVKYSDTDKDIIRDSFVGHEIFHLEGWSQFGIDSANDPITEEHGRIIGAKLRDATLDGTNLERELLVAFTEARAWMGSLIRARQTELDNLTTNQGVIFEATWSEDLDQSHWGHDTIYSRHHRTLDPMSKGGGEEAIPDETAKIKQGELVSDPISLYTLIEEANVWEQKHGKFTHSESMKNLLKPATPNEREKQIRDKRKGSNELQFQHWAAYLLARSCTSTIWRALPRPFG